VFPTHSNHEPQFGCCFKVVTILITAGADPHIKDKCGRTPWDYAQILKSPENDPREKDEVLEIFGVERASRMPPGLHGSNNGLLESRSPANPDKAATMGAQAMRTEREFLVFEAAGNGDVVTLEELLRAEEDQDAWPNIVNCTPYSAKRSPLHAAAHRHQPDAVRLLLQWGADVNLMDFVGRTALSAAMRDLAF
jgi:hypothetical protein